MLQAFDPTPQTLNLKPTSPANSTLNPVEVGVAPHAFGDFRPHLFIDRDLRGHRGTGSELDLGLIVHFAVVRFC